MVMLPEQHVGMTLIMIMIMTSCVGPPQYALAPCKWWLEQPPRAVSLEVTTHVIDAGHCTPSMYQVWSSLSEDTADCRSRHYAAWWAWPLIFQVTTHAGDAGNRTVLHPHTMWYGMHMEYGHCINQPRDLDLWPFNL